MYWRYGCFTRLGVNSAFSTDAGLLVVDEDEEDVSWMRIEIKVSSKYLFKTGKGCFDA